MKTRLRRWRYGVFVMASLVCSLVAGCGSGGQGSSQTNLTITQQPLDASIPLGQAAGFKVFASSSRPISYQWSKDGTVITGATQSSYASPPVLSSDAGSTYSVAVSDAASTLQSRNALLSIGPRSPAAGDLRFQQVGAGTTRDGYVATYLTEQTAPGTTGFGGQFGSPLSIGPGCNGTPAPGAGVYYCSYSIYGFSGPASTALTAYYNSDYLENFPAFLVANDLSNTVITGLNVQPGYDEYGASWIKTADAGGFDLQQHTVNLPDLSSDIQQEGANSRVVTAISYNGSSVTYLSYGWSSDRSTAYDEMVVSSSFSNAGAGASQLSQQGYILTAIGGSFSAGVLMVGTRVHGDSIARPMLTASDGPLALCSAGYAVVGLLIAPTGTPSLFLGEK